MIFLVKLIFWFSLGELVYSYLLYPLLLRFFVPLFGRPPSSSDSYEPTVAVLMSVYNEEKVMSDKLSNIAALEYPPAKLSVWVGSDCSTDRTDELVSACRDNRVHLWRSPLRCGKAGVINQVLPLIDAEIVLLTDADIMFEPNSIRKLVRHYADPEIGGVGGITIPRRRGHEASGEEVDYRRFEVLQKTLEGRLHSSISAFGPFYSFRKRLFVPFHPLTYSNDDVLMPMNIIRQGYRMYFDPEAVSYEEALLNLKLEFARRVRIGAGNFQAFFWLLDFLNPARGWPWFCFVSHKVCRWFSPIFLFLAAASCALLTLLQAGPAYRLCCAAGGVLLAAGFLHAVLPVRLFRRIFYFLAMNAAILLGFFRYLGGIRSAAWQRTERT